jgi:hypothetical protein
MGTSSGGGDDDDGGSSSRNDERYDRDRKTTIINLKWQQAQTYH